MNFRISLLALALLTALTAAHRTSTRVTSRTVDLTSLLSPADKPFDNNVENFDILTRLLNLANLTSTVASLKHFTLFAPNDAAFVRTAKFVTGFSGSNEKDAYDALVAAVLAGVPVKGKVVKGIPLLTTVLKYHIVPARATSRIILGRILALRTLTRKRIISIGNGELIDGSPATPNPVVVAGSVDIMVKNGGVVHVIDAVLLPVPVPVVLEKLLRC